MFYNAGFAAGDKISLEFIGEECLVIRKIQPTPNFEHLNKTVESFSKNNNTIVR